MASLALLGTNPHRRRLAGRAYAAYGGIYIVTSLIWLWGGRKDQIRETILFGRKNHMPAHRELISPDEARVASGYVWSLTRAAMEEGVDLAGDGWAPVTGGK